MGDPLARSMRDQDVSASSVRTGPWGEQEIRTLIELWQQGFSNADISKRMGRPENAIAIKASRLNLPPKSVAAKRIETGRNNQSKARLRPCLCCQTTFFSEGPHHRICDSCKSASSWSSSDHAVSFGGNWR